MYLLLGSQLLPLGIWNHTVLQYCMPVTDSYYECMCLVPLCIQDATLHIRLVLTFLFQDKGEHHATSSESLWTLQLQHSRGAFSSPWSLVFCYISPACRDQKVYNLWALCFTVCLTLQRQLCPGGVRVFDSSSLIQHHLPPALLLKITMMLPPMRMTPLLMRTNNHRPKHRRAMAGTGGELERTKSHKEMEGIQSVVAAA